VVDDDDGDDGDDVDGDGVSFILHTYVYNQIR